VEFVGGAKWPSAGQPAFALRTGDKTLLRSVRMEGQKLLVTFEGGAKAEFA